jgi:bifunctional UDP-N-acetylglucosamine pyrophosphorylase/glucosamine-1-phosphate N-acetyltransferase
MRSGLAKVLHDVQGRSLLTHVLGAVRAAGVPRVSVVVGHQAEAVERSFGGCGLDFVRQAPPRGTGHAVQVAVAGDTASQTGSLLVVNGDLPLLRGQTLRALLEAHLRSGVAATILAVELPDGGPYGRILRDVDGSVLRVVEARDATEQERRVREVNVGVYAFELSSLRPALEGLQPRNAQAEYYLTDVVERLRQAGERVETWGVDDPTETMGVNTLAELAAVARQLRERRVLELLEAGVAIEDPDTTHVGPDTKIEAGATIRPFTLLEGKTVVRGGAAVGPYAHLVDVEVGPGAQVLDHCLLRECVIEEEASVGPFTHVRPGSQIGRRARVGNFVELKKARLGEGSKASHLAYLGDSNIGDSVNVGAGTITCNYDGLSKHQTRIGSRAFVGSNATLVAPVTIGEGAYVAAGSVITEDTPSEALALGRARQVVKEGWARRRREAQERAKAKP